VKPIKLIIPLLGVLVAILQAPVWLTLLFLVIVTGLMADGLLKIAMFFKKKHDSLKRIYQFYQRKQKRSSWSLREPDLPLIEFEEVEWWKN